MYRAIEFEEGRFILKVPLSQRREYGCVCCALRSVMDLFYMHTSTKRDEISKFTKRVGNEYVAQIEIFRYFLIFRNVSELTTFWLRLLRQTMLIPRQSLFSILSPQPIPCSVHLAAKMIGAYDTSVSFGVRLVSYDTTINTLFK